MTQRFSDSRIHMFRSDLTIRDSLQIDKLSSENERSSRHSPGFLKAEMCSTGLIAPESHFYLKIGAVVAEIHLLELETIDEIFKISLVISQQKNEHFGEWITQGGGLMPP